MLHVNLSLCDSLLFSTFLSLGVHWIYNRYEVDPANLNLSFPLLFVVPALPCYFLLANVHSAFLAVAISYTLFYCSLVLSIVLYRLSPLHPLASYPGPLLLKVSKFVGMYHAASGKQHILFKSLHDKYGPFVRTGPNELSITEAGAIPSILQMRKGPMWEAHAVPGTPPNMVAIRNFGEHAERRKLWNHGFTMASLKEYRPVIENCTLKLLEELGKRITDKSGKDEISLDLAQWLIALTYDTAGELVWGEGFGLMGTGAEGRVRAMIEGFAESMSLMHHTPWVMRLVHKLATVPEGARTLFEYTSGQYERRKRQGAGKDIFHFITNEGSGDAEVSEGQGINDVLLAILAGTDTTSSVLSGVFFYILSNRDVFDRLKEEVDLEFSGELPFHTARLAKMPYLNAVINETLRLQPAIPTAIQRSLPGERKEKLVFWSFIPENTEIHVYVPPYALHRDPRYFSPDPDMFMPERWLDASSGKFATDRSAFIPFASGHANCVGKNLAWMEMRMLVAAIVQRFDMKFAEGYDPRRWEEDLHDFIGMQVGKLPVVLFSRE